MSTAGSAGARQARFDVLDSWRGIAACAIALLHFPAYSHFYWLPFLRNSYLFVDFFFVLSGFVIAATYRERLLAGLPVWRFMLLRFGRLYPLHFALLLLFAIWAFGRQFVGGPPFPRLEFIADLTLVQSLVLNGYGLNLPSWSISTEFWTYLIFAGLAATGPLRLNLAMRCAALLGPAFLAAVVGNMDVIHRSDFSLVRCLAGFSCGFLMNGIYRGRKWGTSIELVSVAAIIVFVTLAERTVLSVAAPYVFGAAVLVFASESGAVSRLLAHRAFVYLGTVSYSIYMVHYFICRAVNHLLLEARAFGYDFATRIDDPFAPRSLAIGKALWQGDLAYVAYLALVLVVARITWTWVEAPCREWFRNIATRTPVSGEQAVPGAADSRR